MISKIKINFRVSWYLSSFYVNSVLIKSKTRKPCFYEILDFYHDSRFFKVIMTLEYLKRNKERRILEIYPLTLYHMARILYQILALQFKIQNFELEENKETIVQCLKLKTKTKVQ